MDASHPLQRQETAIEIVFAILFPARPNIPSERIVDRTTPVQTGKGISFMK